MSTIKITIDGYTLTISRGNRKMGPIASLSVPPVVTCPKGVPCAREGCYALRMMRYTGVRTSWAANAAAIEAAPAGLADAIADAIKAKGIKLFRWNVGGDFGLPHYWDLACEVARLCPGIAFYAYTKFFALADRPRPVNFNLVLSAWGDRRPSCERAAVVYVDDGRTPIPEGAHVCGGNCSQCMVCAFARPGASIVIRKH